MNGLFLIAALYLMTLGMGIVLGTIVVICEAFGLPSWFIMAGLLSLCLLSAWECHCNNERRIARMKREITVHTCPRCGSEIPVTRGGHYIVPTGKYYPVVVKAMCADRDSSYYDLCSKCTFEIVEQWLKKAKEKAE